MEKLSNTLSKRAVRALGVTAVTVLLSVASVPLASAASSWSPTLLVNTESFQTIDSGDNSTDIELRFGTSTQTIKFLNSKPVFRFSHSISVLGTMSGSSLNVDRNATVGGTLTVSGATAVRGTLSASGTLALEGHLTGATIAGFGLLSCNATTQKIVYNNSTNRFECATDQNTNAWSNTGSLQGAFDKRFVNTHGDTMTGSLIIRSASGAGAMNLSVIGGMSGYFLRASGAADIHGPLSVSGAIRTDSNLVINDDQTATDVTLTFGHTSNQTLTYLNSKLIFQFSKGISVLGTVSGSSLNVDRNATIGGTLTVSGATAVRGTLSASGTLALEGHLTGATIAGFGLKSCNGAGQTLQWNSSTNRFECGASAIGNSSGGIISLQPQYPNAILFGSGTATVGQLSASGNIVSGVPENYYHWQSSRSGIQDYWVSVRLRLPDNFSSWDPKFPIQFRYRTADGTAGNNHLTVKMRDTSNALVSLTGGAGLTSAGAFTTSDITGPESAGTWTAKGYYTVYVKLAAKTGGYADAGMLTLRYETTTP